MSNLQAVESRIAAISARVRTYRRRKAYSCSLCWERGHTAPSCRLRGLSLWTNGCEVYVARDATHAAAMEAKRVDPECATPLGGWYEVPGAEYTLTTWDGEVTRSIATWVRLNDAGFLAYDGGILAEGRACK